MVNGNTRRRPNRSKVSKHNENTASISSTGNTTATRKTAHGSTSTDISTSCKEPRKNMGNVTHGGTIDSSDDSDDSFLDSTKSLCHDNSYNGRKRKNNCIDGRGECNYDYEEFQQWKKEHKRAEYPVMIGEKSKQDVNEIIGSPGNSKQAFKKIRDVVSANIKNYIKVECYSHMKFCSNDKLAKRLCEESINQSYVVIPSRYTKYEFTHYFRGSVLSGFASLRHNSATLARRNYNGKRNETNMCWLITSSESN